MARQRGASETGRRRFPGISSRAFEHPADRTALTALRSLQGFDTALRKISGLVGERSLRLMHLGSAVRVGPNQFPAVHRLADEAARSLDLLATPEVFVVNDPRAGAMTLGMDRPFIVLNTATIDLLTEDELRFVIGHEVGHVCSGHAVYRTLLYHLIGLASRVAWIPLGVLGVRAIVTALEEWSRKSELSADRAGLLVCQDEEAALHALMKLAGGARIAEMDVAAFLEQAAEYDASGDVRDSVLKLLALQGQTHPFAVLRAAELHRWAGSPDYRQVLDGSYPLRADDPQTSFRAEVRSATRSYAESMRESADPLVTLVRDAASTGQRWWQRFGSDGSTGPTTRPEPTGPPASSPDKTTPRKATPRKATPSKTTPRKTTPRKTTPSKTTPSKTTPLTPPDGGTPGGQPPNR